MPAYVANVTTVQGTGSSIVVPVPPGWVTGDLLLIVGAYDDNIGMTVAPVPPFTNESLDPMEFNQGFSFVFAWLIDATPDADYTFTLSGTTEYAACMLLIKDVDSSWKDVALSVNKENNVSSPEALSVTTTTANALVFRAVGMDDYHLPFTPVGSEDNHVEIGVASGISLHVVSELQAIAGATGSFFFDPTGSDQANSYTIAVRSAAAPEGEVEIDASINLAQNVEVFATASVQVWQNSEVQIDASIVAKQISEVQIDASAEVAFLGVTQIDASINLAQ
ncbi:hypothetical protein LCGC14_1770610, partial [marine sediment metagenome]